MKQGVRYNFLKSLVIHELREQLHVLLHAVDEECLKGFVENEAEILNAVRMGGPMRFGTLL